MEVQVMETSRRMLGEEHPETLTSMNNLAFTLKEQGRKGEAIKLMAECVQLCNQALGLCILKLFIRPRRWRSGKELDDSGALLYL
jgi:Tetratricopeptide repeat